jgi:RHS repeat-associated protein
MFQAAKFGDPVIGVDIHMVLVPAPPAPPIPTPLPHAFVGVVFDPLGAALGAALGAVFGGGGPVFINGLPVGNTGTDVKGMPHVPTPPGVAFAPNDIPGNDGTIVTGSKTVSMAGAACGRLTSLVSTCNFPINLPTSVCLAVPMGAPVLVGGPDTFDIAAAVTRGIRTKWFSDLAHRALKAGPRLSKILCFLTGHPVDVMTGEVLADLVDFDLPGPISLKFERNYWSRDREGGPLGPGWHHPLDASVEEQADRIGVRLPDGRKREHVPLPVGGSLWDDIDRYTLERTTHGYRLTFWDGQRLHFEPVHGTPVTYSLVRITDRCNNAVELRYEDGRLHEVVDSVGRVLELAVASGRLQSIRLRRGQEAAVDLVRYEYDREGRLAAAFDPEGHPVRYAYEGGVLVKETNRNGLSFHFEYDWYDPDGWCVRTWGDGDIYDRRITYDKHGHLTVVDDSRGGRTFYYGNAAGLVDREVDPTGREKRYAWDSTYRKVAEIDGLGNRTEWAYDTRGNMILERDALGQETRWRFNELNVPVERIDAAQGTWKRDFDERGKISRTEDPLGNVARFRHDHRGNLVSVEDPSGRKLSLRYTAAGELTEVIDWEGHATRYELDARGSVIRQMNALGGETVITWDASGRPIAVFRPDGSSARLAYDGEGNVIEHTDGLGNTRRFRYAGLNKLVERIDPAGRVIRYTYDKEESLSGVVNELGEEYHIEVDLAGRVVRERGFDGRTQEGWYDRAGRCVETVNGQKKRTKIERDALGRVVKRVIPGNPTAGNPIPKGEEVEYAYDALGRLIYAKNGASEVVFERDALGRILEEKADGWTIASRYAATGDRVGRRTSLGHETTYDFDGNGDFLGLTFGWDARWKDFAPEVLTKGGSVRAPWRAALKRDAAGAEVERVLPGGVVSRWERDTSGRPATHRTDRDGQPVMGVGYRWRSAEQIAGLIDTQAGPTWFEHDARSYLVAAAWPDGSTQYRAPDAVGNVYRSPDRSDRTYGRAGVLEEAAGVRYVHDQDGQLVEKVMADGKRWRYRWDHAGQLQEVIRPDGLTVTFAYDALGRRVKKTFGGRTTTYVWDGDDLAHEVALGAPLVTWEFDPGTFAPFAKVEGEKRYGVVTDHLGTPASLFDEAGETAWKAQLDIYGVARTDVMRTGCPWRWPGQYEDEETGLYYNRFRYYDPDGGRYISQDPIGLEGGPGPYEYVHDPLCWVDPYGLSGCKVQGQENLRRLGLGEVELAGQSFNSGRRALERSGFDLIETTSTGRKVFANSRTGARVYYDSGKALVPGQVPHWHITDAGGQGYGRTGRAVDSSEGAGHIPAAR